MESGEDPDENDIEDLEVCTQAILSDCNMLLMEEKWVNEELIDQVLESVGLNKELSVYKDFEEFISDLKK